MSKKTKHHHHGKKHHMTSQEAQSALITAQFNVEKLRFKFSGGAAPTEPVNDPKGDEIIPQAVAAKIDSISTIAQEWATAENV